MQTIIPPLFGGRIKPGKLPGSTQLRDENGTVMQAKIRFEIHNAEGSALRIFRTFQR
jgi:hypothetical protein